MMTPEIDHDFEELLEFIKNSRGFDFTGYKRSSLMRRFTKRMQRVNITGYPEYLDYLQVHSEEFSELFNTILINVTRFFRDPQAWELLKQEIIPQILEKKGPNQPVRAWSVGCASGEEAYSLAILLAEAMGKDDFLRRAKVYATDVDEPAITAARHASYAGAEMENMPEQYRDTYFQHVGTSYVFDKELRRSVIFGVHDIVQSAPISRLDILLCRNTLMYFNSEMQDKILARFHFALNQEGILFLGTAETMLTRDRHFFKVLNQKYRIFQKIGSPSFIDQSLLIENRRIQEQQNLREYPAHKAWEATFRKAPAAQLLIDRQGILIGLNDKAIALFDIKKNDLGRPFYELEVSYRPIELRPAIQQAVQQNRAISFSSVERKAAEGKEQYLDIHVIPLDEGTSSLAGTNITFYDVTELRRMQKNIERTNVELEHAYEDLQSANEKIETTNEELQSTVEELETANEELQSSNEEMETMNEELQATNEELQTVNDQYREKTDQLAQMNAFRESILSSVPLGIAVIDRSFAVLMWNRRAEQFWGLRADEVTNQSFPNLDIGLPVERLRKPLRAIIDRKSSMEEMNFECSNRLGKPIEVRVTCSPLAGQEQEVAGVIIIMEQIDNKRQTRDDDKIS